MSPSASPFRAFLLALALLPVLAAAPLAQPAASLQPPALEAIQAEDLRRDLFTLASDAMRGRRAGTLDELRSAAWIAEQARAAGIDPAGDDGTYFQFFEMRRTMLDPASELTVAGRTLRWGEDAMMPFPITATVDAPIAVFGVDQDLRGKVVFIQGPPPENQDWSRDQFGGVQHFSNTVFQRLPLILAAGPAAIIAMPDDVTEGTFDTLEHLLAGGSYALEGEAAGGQQIPLPVIVVRPGSIPVAELAGASAAMRLQVLSFAYPSVNVVGRVPGDDPALAQEHVLFSAHYDHDGVAVVDGEKAVWNGADDNGSGSVALLAIGRAFRAAPGRRSALFVWHGAEERGLLGSRLYAQAPTIDRDHIVAVLNADMIGRNHPDTAAVLGLLPGNRNSRDLAEAALEANRTVGRFVLDQTYDAPDHPEQFFQRSDHYPYVVAGIPGLFFTTLLHPEYHTPADTPDLIDYDKLARMARWMYATAWIVASRDERPALDE